MSSSTQHTIGFVTHCSLNLSLSGEAVVFIFFYTTLWPLDLLQSSVLISFIGEGLWCFTSEGDVFLCYQSIKNIYYVL